MAGHSILKLEQELVDCREIEIREWSTKENTEVPQQVTGFPNRMTAGSKSAMLRWVPCLQRLSVNLSRLRDHDFSPMDANHNDHSRSSVGGRSQRFSMTNRPDWPCVKKEPVRRFWDLISTPPKEKLIPLAVSLKEPVNKPVRVLRERVTV